MCVYDAGESTLFSGARRRRRRRRCRPAVRCRRKFTRVSPFFVRIARLQYGPASIFTPRNPPKPGVPLVRSTSATKPGMRSFSNVNKKKKNRVLGRFYFISDDIVYRGNRLLLCRIYLTTAVFRYRGSATISYGRVIFQKNGLKPWCSMSRTGVNNTFFFFLVVL